MKLIDGMYSCTLCGAPLDISEAATITTIAGSSGKPNMRILSADGREIHRCAMRAAPRRKP
jgi:hypothetical protein